MSAKNADGSKISKEDVKAEVLIAMYQAKVPPSFKNHLTHPNTG
jgi:hypothetical protein